MFGRTCVLFCFFTCKFEEYEDVFKYLSFLKTIFFFTQEY